MQQPAFPQLTLFAKELLRMVDEGKFVSIESVCDNIAEGTIVQFIKTECGFKNSNLTPETISDVNDILKERNLNRDEVKKRYAITKNGLIFIVSIIIDDLNSLLYDMEFNNVSP